jgi:hypothetical protein
MIPPLANFTNHFSLLVGANKEEWDHCAALKEGVPGWSKIEHYLFFRELMKSKPNARILVCGVYHGLDMRYMAGIAEKLGQKVELVGVDLFENKECADWPEELRGKGLTWEQSMHNAPPPSEEASRKNCPSATIYKGNSAEWMTAYRGPAFDIVFLDSSHDFGTVSDEIMAARNILRYGGILAGDDYPASLPSWGVDRAVQALLPNHIVLFNRIWVSA